MDTTQIRIILPNDRLARQVEQRLAGQARTEREPSNSMDLATIAVLVSIGATLASIGATRAQAEASRAQAEATRMAALKTMLEIKQQLVQQGQAGAARIGAPGSAPRSFADADETFLRQLLGLPAE
jgi:hypothetical protein